MKHKLKIEIIGDQASLFLVDEKAKIADRLTWTDRRDLSEKLLRKIDLLLKKNKLSLKHISKFDFYCDSPYFGKNQKLDIKNKNLFSKNKCGFMSWQIGEITTKIMNWKLGN